MVVLVIIGIFCAVMLYVHVLLSNNEIEKNCRELQSEIVEYYKKSHGDIYDDDDDDES